MNVSLRILVVDDEPGMRMGAKRALSQFSVTFSEVSQSFSFIIDDVESGEKAIDYLNDNSPDIVLLDHKLPGISGLEVLDYIKKIPEDIRPLTIMITAYASLETAIIATRRGADDFLAKPFTPDELKSSVRKTSHHLILQREARRLALEKKQVRFQFISVLAHELKAPINAVSGYLQIINDHTLGDDPAAYDHMIERSLVRLDGMRKLIQDLLDMTRIESGQKKRVLEKVNVLEIIDKSVESFMPDAEKKNISINVDCDTDLFLMADAGEIEIIMNNLISNAIKYNKDNGSVSILVENGDDSISVRVADTGIGMTIDEKSRLFEDFSRIRNSKTKDILGSGLGLAILKKLAFLYGGDVTVDSEPEKGTVFSVVLKKDYVPETTDSEAEAKQDTDET